MFRLGAKPKKQIVSGLENRKFTHLLSLDVFPARLIIEGFYPTRKSRELQTITSEET